jgi:hypothetical protein
MLRCKLCVGMVDGKASYVISLSVFYGLCTVVRLRDKNPKL